MAKRKNIICFGGGSALPTAVLSPLSKYDFNITSVVSMLDNGGSSGQLMEDFNILHPGDIRRHILALSDAPEWKKKLWSFRFGHELFVGGHEGHSFANIFIAGLEISLKDYEKTLKFIHEFMEVKGTVLPAITKRSKLYAELENGEAIIGENEIDVANKHDSNLKIKRIYIKPETKTYPPVLKAVRNANLIIIGPGDLYSSCLPCFLSKGIKSAIKKSKAKKLFICNIMTKSGETNNFSVLNFTSEIEKYIGTKLDYVLYNSMIPSKERIEECRKKEPQTLEFVRINENLDPKKFIGSDILINKGPLHHDPKKLAKLIMGL